MSRIHRSIKRRADRGFTLLEILAVIFFIGVIAFFLLRNRAAAEIGTQTQGAVNQTLRIFEGVQSVYKFHKYANLTTANYIASRDAPEEMVSGTTLVHDLGGQITLAPANCNGGTANCFTATVTLIPGAACAKYVSSLQAQASQIQLGSTVVKNSSTAYDQAAVNTACDTASSTVTFTKA